MSKIELDQIIAWKQINDRRKTIHLWFVFEKIMYRCTHSSAPSYGAFDFTTSKARQELIEAMVQIMFEEDSYPQRVYDFITLNCDFIMFVKALFCFIDKFDETNGKLVKEMLNVIINAMKKLSEIECQIVKEQQMRDVITGRFLKPTFNINYLVYTYTLASVINAMKSQYNKVNRIEVLENHLWHTYSSFKDVCDQGENAKQLFLSECQDPSPLSPWVRGPHSELISASDMLANWRKFERWYEQEKNNPFTDVNTIIEPYLKAQYNCLWKD